MNPRNIARVVGMLFIIGTVAGVGSFVGMGPLSASDYLVNVAANETKVRAGALLVLIMGIALAPVPVLLYPILKKYNESLALGYVVFRTFEVVTDLGISISWLMLLTLSKEFVQAGAPAGSYYQTLGTLLKAAGEWMDPVLVIVFSISAVILNYVFYKSKLIPSWLSSWGFVGAVLHLAEGVFAFIGLPEISVFGVPVFLPIALQEMVYAVWLIVKGFDSSALDSLSIDTDINVAVTNSN